MAMIRILFICTGNTCRSPMAASYLRRLLEVAGRSGVEVSSAGTFAGAGEPASAAALMIMRDYGVDLTGHRSTPLTMELIRDADLIVAMTAAHRRHVGAMSAAALAKTRELLSFGTGGDIGDPFGGDAADYADCFQGMKSALEALSMRLDDVLREIRNDGGSSRSPVKAVEP